MSIHSQIARRAIDLSNLDGTTDAGPTIGLYSGSGGDMVVVFVDDVLTDTTTLAGVPAGVWLPVSIKKWVSGPSNAVGFA